MEDTIALLLFGLFLYWVTPVVLLILGLTRLRKRPENAKILLIAAGIMLIVGVGVCTALLR